MKTYLESIAYQLIDKEPLSRIEIKVEAQKLIAYWRIWMDCEYDNKNKIFYCDIYNSIDEDAIRTTIYGMIDQILNWKNK